MHAWGRDYPVSSLCTEMCSRPDLTLPHGVQLSGDCAEISGALQAPLQLHSGELLLLIPASTALQWKPTGLPLFAVNGCCWAWGIQYPELCAACTDVSATTPIDSSSSRNSRHSLSHQSSPQRGRDGHRGCSWLWEAFWKSCPSLKWERQQGTQLKHYAQGFFASHCWITYLLCLIPPLHCAVSFCF